MRRSRFALVLVLIGLLLTALVAPGAGAAPKGQPSLTLPDYAQRDVDDQREAAAAGVKLTGKDFRGYNPGHSYKSPGNGSTLGHLDVRGSGRKGLAILVDWPVETAGAVSDVPGVNYAALPPYIFNDLLNSETYDPYALPMFADLATFEGQPAPTDRTMKTYYDEVSYGQFGMTVDVVGWVTLPHSYDYYVGQNKGYYNENGDAHVGELVSDAVRLAAALPNVNLADYAVPAVPGDFVDLYGNATSFTTKDGQVVGSIIPNLFIIHRGTGAEYGGVPTIIWSHKWDVLSATYYGHYYRTGMEPPLSSLEYLVADGVAVNTYNIVPEVGQNITGYNLPAPRRPSPPYVGVFAHEFGHVLGLPDQYDYGYDSEGTGIFSLMASGSYGRSIQNRFYSGNSPTHMDAWSKYYLGFLTPTVVTPSPLKQTFTLRPVHQYPDVYKLPIPGSDGREYFLMENRQQQGFDKGLAYSLDANPYAVHGLIVYQIDENVLLRNFHRPNEAQNPDWNKRGNNYRSTNGENHYGVTVIQADGRYDLEYAANDGDATDLFPGKTNITSLLPNPMAGKPNTVSWYQWAGGRSITGITLSNIVENADGSVTVDVTYAQ